MGAIGGPGAVKEALKRIEDDFNSNMAALRGYAVSPEMVEHVRAVITRITNPRLSNLVITRERMDTAGWTDLPEWIGDEDQLLIGMADLYVDPTDPGRSTLLFEVRAVFRENKAVVMPHPVQWASTFLRRDEICARASVYMLRILSKQVDGLRLEDVRIVHPNEPQGSFELWIRGELARKRDHSQLHITGEESRRLQYDGWFMEHRANALLFTVCTLFYENALAALTQ